MEILSILTGAQCGDWYRKKRSQSWDAVPVTSITSEESAPNRAKITTYHRLERFPKPDRLSPQKGSSGSTRKSKRTCISTRSAEGQTSTGASRAECQFSPSLEASCKHRGSG